ncbi:unnamed protein product, partial [Cuscuta europaea]
MHRPKLKSQPKPTSCPKTRSCDARGFHPGCRASDKGKKATYHGTIVWLVNRQARPQGSHLLRFQAMSPPRSALPTRRAPVPAPAATASGGAGRVEEKVENSSERSCSQLILPLIGCHLYHLCV